MLGAHAAVEQSVITHNPPSDRTSQSGLVDPNFKPVQRGIIDPNIRNAQGSLIDPNVSRAHPPPKEALEACINASFLVQSGPVDWHLNG